MNYPKFPYKLKLREIPLNNFLLNIAQYNPRVINRYRYRVTNKWMKSPVEIELSKFTCEAEGRDYCTWPWLLGCLAAMGCFVWSRQAKRLRDDLHDPGRDVVYAAPFSVWLRLLRMRIAGYISTRALLFAELQSRREVRVEGWQTAKWKKDFLLAERLKRFQRRRQAHFDFVELGDADLLRVPG